MEWYGYVVIGMIGLIVGSFLNVVIVRLPKMLLHADEQERAEYNLVKPRSHCPRCHHPIRILENIPVISFIFLKGRCQYCQQPISWRYPFVEVLTAVFSMILFYFFQFTPFYLIGTLLFTWALIALTFIDFENHILPDDITLPLLWAGLAFNIKSVYIPLDQAVLGALLGYGFLWIVYWLFKLLTGKEGLGYGDFKLLAALGAWVGWLQLPVIILLASVVGALVGITAILLKYRTSSQPIPFGPFLAAAGWISLIWGNKIMAYYLTCVLPV